MVRSGVKRKDGDAVKKMVQKSKEKASSPKRALKKTVKKASVKTAKKAVVKTRNIVKKTVSTPTKKSVSVASASVSHKLTNKEKQVVKEMLLAIRDRLRGQISSLTKESLERNDSIVSVEDGTDAFDRQFALTVASTEHDALLETEEALQRFHTGAYGVCESCAKNIEKPRLKALPFVRLCIKCKSESEKGKMKYRPI